MTKTVFDVSGNNAMEFQCGSCGRRGIVYYTTRRPEYCNDACKQRAYRQRKRNSAVVTNRGQSEGRIEADLDMGLHLLVCSCGRGIWTVKGNVHIGGLHCNLCSSDFREA